MENPRLSLAFGAPPHSSSTCLLGNYCRSDFGLDAGDTKQRSLPLGNSDFKEDGAKS